MITEPDPERRAFIFHPHMRNGKPGDRHIGKTGKPLQGQAHSDLAIDTSIDGNSEQQAKGIKPPSPMIATPMRYAFRSLDRQWLIPDSRLINQPAPKLWTMFGHGQIFLTAEIDRTPLGGPAIGLTSLMPDMHHYGGRGGHVYALWKNAGGGPTNIMPNVVTALTKAYGTVPDPVDIFAYVAALLAHPAYIETFKADLIRPGLRVPLTADKTLFAEAAALGRGIIWLHTFGERMNEGRPAGEPRLPPDRRPVVPADGAIPSTPEGFPDTIDYDPAKQRLKIGSGFIDHVTPAIWAYEVSGKQVLRQWFSYRKKNRERPQIGDKRPPSPLQKIQPDHWLPEYTGELLNVLNVLGMLIDLEPRQAALLARIIDPDSPLIPASKIGGTPES